MTYLQRLYVALLTVLVLMGLGLVFGLRAARTEEVPMPLPAPRDLYIMMYMDDKVGGTVGPLPYGLDECLARAAHEYGMMRDDLVTPDGHSKKDFRLACERHHERPMLELQ